MIKYSEYIAKNIQWNAKNLIISKSEMPKNWNLCIIMEWG